MPVAESDHAGGTDSIPEREAEDWYLKYDTDQERDAALRALEQRIEDAVIRDGNARALANEVVRSLSRAYVEHYAELDVRMRVHLIKLLCFFRDPRAEPAMRKALEEFARRPTRSQEETDIRWVMRAQQDLQLESLAEPLLEVFAKVEFFSPLGALVKKDLREALLVTARRYGKDWPPRLHAMLVPDIPKKSRDDITPYANQVYWQVVAALLLGEISDASSVRPLLHVVLDPLKADVATTAILALVKLGRPSVDAGIALLEGRDRDLIDFHAQRVMRAQGLSAPPKDEPHVAMAAIILGIIGHPMAREPVIQAVRTTRHDGNRATLLQELPKFAVVPGSVAAFEAGFARLSPTTELPLRRVPALPALAEVSARFYEPALVDWLLERARQARGTPDQREALRDAVLGAALRLAQPGQLPKVDAAIQRYSASRMPRIRFYEPVERLAKECGKRVSCYLDAVARPDLQAYDYEMGSIKAAYMLGILGDEKTARQLVGRLDRIENASVAAAALGALDHLLPTGSTEIADLLDELLKAHAKTADAHKMQADSVIREVSYRLRARAKS